MCLFVSSLLYLFHHLFMAGKLTEHCNSAQQRGRMCMLNVDKYVTWACGNTREGQTGAAPQFLIMALFVTVSLSAGQPNVTTKTTIKKRYSEAAYYHFFKVSFWRMAQRQISLCKWDFWKQSSTWISPKRTWNLAYVLSTLTLGATLLQHSWLNAEANVFCGGDCFGEK